MLFFHMRLPNPTYSPNLKMPKEENKTEILISVENVWPGRQADCLEQLGHRLLPPRLPRRLRFQRYGAEKGKYWGVGGIFGTVDGSDL